MIKSLKWNWLLVSKLTWGIDMGRALESLKYFKRYVKQDMYIYILFVLKTYRGVIFHDTEEWCKI